MKVSDNTKEFLPCPEYQGQGCIVDVTPIKTVDTAYGKRDIFRIVIETQELNDEGEPWHVWSTGFTPTLHEKSGLRKFLKGLLGRDLNEDERKDFETESLIGMNCFVVVVHAIDGEKVYANIAACTPWKGGGALMTPHPSFKRAKDRPAQDVTSRKTDQPKTTASTTTAATKTAAKPAAAEPVDHASCKVHVGTHRGSELREMDPKSIDKLVLLWLPDAKAAAKQSADDKRLIAALEWYEAQKGSSETADDVPY